MSDLSHLHAPPSAWHQALNAPWLRRLAVLVLLAAIWEVAAIIQNNPIMLPRFTAVVAALWQSVLHDGLLASAWVSIEVLLRGYVIAVALALLLVGLAAVNSFARDALQTLTAMLNPLPAIALLPLAMLKRIYSRSPVSLRQGTVAAILLAGGRCSRS